MPNDEIVWDSAPAPERRPALLNAVKYVESRGNPNAVSPAGAVGPYQFMPATARELGVTNPRDEEQARAGADRYLSQLEGKYGDTNLALLAYNWGPGNVDAWLKTGKGVKGGPAVCRQGARRRIETVGGRRHRLGCARPEEARAEDAEATVEGSR